MLEMFKHETCPADPPSQTAVPLHGSFTFHHLIKYVAAACTVVTFILSIFLIISHLRCYTIPREQKQIVRIVFTPFVFSIIGLASILSYNAATYLMPLALLYEALSLASIFLLFVYSMIRDSGSVQQFFATQDEKTMRGTLKGFFKTWTIVFIYPVAYAILVLAEEVSQATGRYCARSLSPRFGHIWIQVLEVIIVGVAVVAVLKFFKSYKSLFGVRRPMSKFISFKLIVFVNVLQTFVFNILSSRVNGSSKVTYKDISIGIPAVLVCVEQTIFAAILMVTFRAKEYNEDSRAKQGLSAAVADALNPADLVVSIGRAFQYLFRRQPVMEP